MDSNGRPNPVQVMLQTVSVKLSSALTPAEDVRYWPETGRYQTVRFYLLTYQPERQEQGDGVV